MAIACEMTVPVNGYTITFNGETPLGGGLVRWCWTITNVSSQTALSHWDIQTCILLTLDQLKQVQITNATPPPGFVFTANTPAAIAAIVDFKAGFPDGFPVYGMKTNVPDSIPPLVIGRSYQFCFDFDESAVPLTPVPGLVAVKSGGGPTLDALASGLCSPGCGAVTPPPGRGFRV